MVKVKFASEKLSKVCSSDAELQRHIRKKKAPHSPDDILQVLNDLMAAPTVADLLPHHNYHLLKHEFSGCAAVDVRVLGAGGRGKWRMVFELVSECNDVNKTNSIKEVIVKELLVNYHKRKD